MTRASSTGRSRPLFLRDLPVDEARVIYWRNFRTLVGRLLAAGKRVYIVAPVPELPAAADYFVFKAGGDPNNRPAAPLDYYRRRQAPILAEIESLASIPGVTILQPSRALCGRQRCAAIFQGQALYFDDN